MPVGVVAPAGDFTALLHPARGHMQYAIRRILGIIPVLFFTWTIVFGVMQLIPGDPVNLMLAGVPGLARRCATTSASGSGSIGPCVERYVTFLGKRCARGPRRVLSLAAAGHEHDHRSRPARPCSSPQAASSSGSSSALLLGMLAGTDDRTPGSIPLCMLVALAGSFAAEFLDRHDADLRVRHDAGLGADRRTAASRR